MNAGDLFLAQQEAADVSRNLNIAYGMVCASKPDYAAQNVELALEATAQLIKILARLKAPT